MAYRRMLSVGISVSEQVADLRDDFTRLLFTWMIPHADDWGVLPGAARRVRALVLPLSERTVAQVEEALADMEQHELIWRYADADGRPWIQFRKWEVHQQGLHKRTKPKSPLYQEVMGYTKELPDTSRNLPEIPSEVNYSEVNLIGSEENHTREAAKPHVRSPVATADADGDDDSADAVKAKQLFAEQSEPMRLATYLKARILHHKPDTKLPPNLQGWARDFDLMLRVDKRSYDNLHSLIDYATGDSFWRGVIFSAGKLRQKYDTLDVQRQEKANATTTKAAAGTTYANGTGARRGAVHASAPAQPDAHNHGPYAHLFDRK